MATSGEMDVVICVMKVPRGMCVVVVRAVPYGVDVRWACRSGHVTLAEGTEQIGSRV